MWASTLAGAGRLVAFCDINAQRMRVQAEWLEDLNANRQVACYPADAFAQMIADEALDTLRDLARGIYPPLLADKGLVAALRAQASKATLPVEVESDGIDRYVEDIEAAVYFCCLEALQNIQKYAAAQSAIVKLDGSESGLTFEVTDDGEGFDSASVKRGAGLTNMTDRIDALGGRLEVSSTPERGTRVYGSLPALVGVAPA